MKSIKELTDDVIDLVHENTYSEIDEWQDEDGAGYEINLSPKPELYDKLNAYFSNIYVEIMIDVLSSGGDEKPYVFRDKRDIPTAKDVLGILRSQKLQGGEKVK